MKIALVDTSYRALNRDSLRKEALGSSETWLLQIAQQFDKMKHSVDIYCNIDKMDTIGLTTFIPLDSTIERFLKSHYDILILNRSFELFNMDLIGTCLQYNIADKVYLQIHDLSLIKNKKVLEDEQIPQTLLHLDRLDGIVCLNDWHAKNLRSQYTNIDHSKVFTVPNGVDLSLFPTKKPKPDHRILWSSCTDRGLDILINDIYPIVRERIPDFGIDVAGYLDINVDIAGRDIKILGNLNKTDLYKEMNKHAVWFYPSTFAETFCITMIENAICKNVIVSPMNYGMKCVLDNPNKTFSDFEKNYQAAILEAADKIVDAINNYDMYSKSLLDVYNQAKQYTWRRVAESYINLDNTVEHQYEGIILCEANTKEDIEKYIERFDGKLPEGYNYFIYTCLDVQRNPHLIYVDGSSGTDFTYKRFKNVFRELENNNITARAYYLYLNDTEETVENIIKNLNSISEREVIGSQLGFYTNRTYHDLLNKEFQFNFLQGNQYLSYDILHGVAYSHFDDSVCYIRGDLDVTIWAIINEMRMKYVLKE